MPKQEVDGSPEKYDSKRVDLGTWAGCLWRTILTANSYSSLLRRLAKAGFRREFLRAAILPDWWTEECANDPALLPEIEIRAARFLGIPLATLREPTADLTRTVPQGAQLRRVRDIGLDRLAPAIHAALQIGKAVQRNRRPISDSPGIPGADARVWRNLLGADGAIALSGLLAFLWERGVPVIPLDCSPSPTFQALAAVVESGPIIVLGHRIDEPGRVAFVIAHEIAHIAYGDCQLDCPVVEASDEVADDASIEVRADDFARALLLGERQIPVVDADDYRTLANAADEAESVAGVDAGAVIWAWANRTRDYVTAQRALAALYRHIGAQRELRRQLLVNVDFDGAIDSDRDLLRCVMSESDDDPSAI